MVGKPLLKTLTLDRVRGASRHVNIEFPSKPITLIFGENGSGKSSLIDGLELILRGTAGSIADMSGASIASHLASLNSKTSDIVANATFADGSVCSAEVVRNQIKTRTTCPVTPLTAILRKFQILDLITAIPSERYKALARFIDVSGVESAEENLVKAIAVQSSELTSKRQNLNDSILEIKRLYNENRDTSEHDLTPEAWAKQQIDINAETLISLSKLAGESSRALSTALDDMDQATKQQVLVDAARVEEKLAQTKYDEMIKVAPNATDLLIGLFKAGKDYFDAVEEIEICPICGQPADKKQAVQNIINKLDSLPGIPEAKSALADARDKVKTATKLAYSSYDRLFQSARKLYGCYQQLPPDFFGNEKPELSFEILLTDTLDKDTIAASKNLVNALTAYGKTWETKLQKIDARKVLLSSIVKHCNTISRGTSEIKELENASERLNSMLKVVKPLRQGFVNRILASVGADCDAIYSKIHPSEKLGKPVLELDEKRKASCHISAEFCGQTGLPPQAYFSESHMDTLGFSFFVALAKRQHGSDGILIIDDIFTSVDDNHLERICLVLADESNNFRQIILATHSRKIFDWVRSGKLPQKMFGVIELSSKWNLDDGIVARGAITERNEIEKDLAGAFLERTSFAAKTRRLLEGLLGDLVMDLGATSRMKRYGDYSLSDYVCGLQSVSKEGWTIHREDVTEESTAVYNLRAKATEFNQSSSVVNKLIHASADGTSYSDDELRHFAQETLALDTFLRCGECGSLPSAKKDPKTCKCGKVRLVNNRG